MDLICINDTFTPEQIRDIPHRPVKDAFYTIRELLKTGNGPAVLLNEIHNPNTGWTIRAGMKFTFEPSFALSRFSTLEGEPVTAEMIREHVLETVKIKKMKEIAIALILIIIIGLVVLYFAPEENDDNMSWWDAP